MPKRHSSNGYMYFSVVLFFFTITAARVVPCGGSKKSPYIIYSEDYIFLLVLGILRNKKLIIGIDAFSKHNFNVWHHKSLFRLSC